MSLQVNEASRGASKAMFTWEKLSLCVVVEDDCGPRSRFGASRLQHASLPILHFARAAPWA